MEDGFDLDNMWESLDLTGQRQPSAMPDILDSSLNSQILDDILLSADYLSPPTSSNNSDDIGNALIDTSMDPFENFLPIVNPAAESSLETDELTKLMSTVFEELPTQSTIVDEIEKMTLNQSQIDILSSSTCIQIGSSPVEQKEIENSILAKKLVRKQQRIYTDASNSEKRSGYQQSSSTVGPIDILSTYSGCQPCSTIQIQDDFDYQQQILQCDSMESKKIQIISHPRPNFRPRTQPM